jgi:hypothetical protein
MTKRKIHYCEKKEPYPYVCKHPSRDSWGLNHGTLQPHAVTCLTCKRMMEKVESAKKAAEEIKTRFQQLRNDPHTQIYSDDILKMTAINDTAIHRAWRALPKIPYVKGMGFEIKKKEEPAKSPSPCVRNNGTHLFGMGMGTRCVMCARDIREMRKEEIPEGASIPEPIKDKFIPLGGSMPYGDAPGPNSSINCASNLTKTQIDELMAEIERNLNLARAHKEPPITIDEESWAEIKKWRAEYIEKPKPSPPVCHTCGHTIEDHDGSLCWHGSEPHVAGIGGCCCMGFKKKPLHLRLLDKIKGILRWK